MQPLEHAVFVDIHKGVEQIRFNPNYWQSWSNAIEYVTRTNPMEGSDRKLPWQISFTTKFANRYAKLQVIIRKRRMLLKLVSKHNSKHYAKEQLGLL